MNKQNFPPGWDENRVQELIAHYENQTEEEEMANRRELVVEQLHALADDLEELWKAATRDPAAERRKQRGWLLLTGALGAVATMASRKALAKLWPILTGEPAPGTKAPGVARERDRGRDRDRVA